MCCAFTSGAHRYNNTKPLGLGTYGGVVGVDHYWTHQGMPCLNGEPQEFNKQDVRLVLSLF